nr:hypothetical protein [Mycoplasmopsis bovis]
MLNDVHGNPDKIISTSGMSLTFTFLMSTSETNVEKLDLYVNNAFLSNSFAHMVLNFPVCSKPKSIPPTPANKLHTLYICLL